MELENNISETNIVFAECGTVIRQKVTAVLKETAFSIFMLFRKICKKATIIFVTSVCLSVRMEQLGSHRTDFREI